MLMLAGKKHQCTQPLSHRDATSLRSLPSLLDLFLDYNFADISGDSTALSLTSIPLANSSLFGWSDEAVNGPMVQNSFFSVILSFLVGLRPHVSIQLTVSLASRARGPREICILLDERLFTDLAIDPCGGWLSKKAWGENVVTRDSNWRCVVEVRFGLGQCTLDLLLFERNLRRDGNGIFFFVDFFLDFLGIGWCGMIIIEYFAVDLGQSRVRIVPKYKAGPIGSGKVGRTNISRSFNKCRAPSYSGRYGLDSVRDQQRNIR